MDYNLDHPFFPQLRGLALPADDYVIAGSAPLFVRRLRSEMHDLDVVAGSNAWSIATLAGSVEAAPLFGDQVQMIHPADTGLEILNAWFPVCWKTVQELIETCDVIEGLNFLSLKNTLTWKRYTNRVKDRVDIVAIEKFLDSVPPS